MEKSPDHNQQNRHLNPYSVSNDFNKKIHIYLSGMFVFRYCFDLSMCLFNIHVFFLIVR